MDLSSNTASTLTRYRATAAIAVATVATLSYFVYRAVFDPLPPEPALGQRLHRSNAVRRRQRSIAQPADVPSLHDDEDGDSFTSAESHGDENMDLNTVRPLADGETVAEEHVMEDEWWHDAAHMPQQRAGQNIVSLLFRVSEDNAHRNAYVHRGCQCNACGVTPIRGIRYRCANCADFDLCETCESQGLHIKTHIFYKVKIPAPPFGPRQMQAVWYPGDPETSLRNLPRSLMAKLSKETGFERPELEAFWEQWTFMANTEWREDPDDLCLAMDRQTFERCLVPSGGYRHTAPSLIHDRMFAFYDTNNDDLIGFSEFLYGLSFRKRKDKLHKIFEGYDIDKDGYVTRRDFLRIFRAYYVLYKQMHRDILEGLDDQVMSSTEAHQLVTSRQPLSSLFGRDGRVPRADEDRPLQGKVFHSSGEIGIHDGKAVVDEDRPDTTDRQDILANLMSKDDTESLFVEDAFTPVSETAVPTQNGGPDPSYWTALMFPPSQVDQFEPLLAGEARDDDMIFGDLDRSSAGPLRELAIGESSSEPVENGVDATDDTDALFVVESVNDERRVNFLPEFAGAPARHRQNNTHSPVGRAERLKKRRSRINTRKKLLDRWKRRQFYLDEEEGAVPPVGWKDEDDVLANLDGAAESSKAAQALLSPRSRSSSKVRFAEDTDDYDIRSNPSTSSRSVPERWGGMDIPDAERDAGKEILYQVTQQAFNELLDIVFKAKEDLALKCAETKALRDQYRPLFSTIDLKEEDDLQVAAQLAAEDPNPQTQSLPELLLRSGYSIDESLGISTATLEEMSRAGWDETTEEVQLPSVEEAKLVDIPEYRDPTMPQFRPNSSPARPSPDESGSTSGLPSPIATPDGSSLDETKGPAHGEAKKGTNDENQRPAWAGSNSKSPPNGTAKEEPAEAITNEKLVEWRRLDQAEEEARRRGGWGKISYEEFEQIYKYEENRANRLDYLGSWIDFCIP
ncbi:EF-hand [Thozetella sp. PMI_491]|nr:EF-hand [Thozetella sp. PMI_491]